MLNVCPSVKIQVQFWHNFKTKSLKPVNIEGVYLVHVWNWKIRESDIWISQQEYLVRRSETVLQHVGNHLLANNDQEMYFHFQVPVGRVKCCEPKSLYPGIQITGILSHSSGSYYKVATDKCENLNLKRKSEINCILR